MSKLQSNFTTIEQSKRLLELGFPANSADCFHPTDLQQNPIEDATPTIITYQLDIDEIEWDKVSAFPCWSVGRLIEILEIILGSPWSDKELLGKQGTLLERVVSDFEDVVKYKEIFKDNRIDFNKLEE